MLPLPRPRQHMRRNSVFPAGLDLPPFTAGYLPAPDAAVVGIVDPDPVLIVPAPVHAQAPDHLRRLVLVDNPAVGIRDRHLPDRRPFVDRVGCLGFAQAQDEQECADEQGSSPARLLPHFSNLPGSEVSQAGNCRPRHRQSTGTLVSAARCPHRLPISRAGRSQCRTELAGIDAMARPPGRIPRPRRSGHDPAPMPVKQVNAEKADQSQTQDDFGGGHDLDSDPSPDADVATCTAKVDWQSPCRDAAPRRSTG